MAEIAGDVTYLLLPSPSTALACEQALLGVGGGRGKEDQVIDSDTL